MNILAFDTSSTACTVAILQTTNGNDHITINHVIAPLQQARLILPMIHETICAAGLTLNTLDAIAYGCGPGSFTGTRISVSVAQGLGLALNRPLIPVSSMAVIAQSAYLEHKWQKILVALDARMGQIYFARYELANNGLVKLSGLEKLCDLKKLDDLEAISLFEMPDYSDTKDWYGAGDGWDKLLQQHSKNLNTINPSQLPTAKALAMLAKQKFEQGGQIAADKAFPVYLR